MSKIPERVLDGRGAADASDSQRRDGAGGRGLLAGTDCELDKSDPAGVPKDRR
jgi:hypothetical protein